MKLTIKNILIAVAVAIILSAGAAGYISLSGLKGANDGANNLNDNIIPGVQQAEELNVALGDLRIAQGEALADPSPQHIQISERDMNDAKARIKSWGDKYEAALPSAEEDKNGERDIWSKLKADTSQYITMNDAFLSQIKTGQVEAARASYIASMDDAYTPLGDGFDKLIKINFENGERVNAENDKNFATIFWQVGAAIAVVVLLSILSLWVAVFVVSKPINTILTSMNQLIKGQLNITIPYLGKPNEIGDIASALDVFRKGLVEADTLRAEAAEREKTAAAERKKMMLGLADDFEKSVGGIVGLVSSAATEMQAAAAQLSATAQEASAQSVAVSAAAEEAGANVTSVASSTEELGASVSEIGRQVETSASIASGAVKEAEDAQLLVVELDETAASIGGVVELIAGLASQTNLLALNATIESARAGEAGKGFAVVAAEVKALAAQTAKATTDISEKIAKIQNATSRASTAMRSIGGTIQSLNHSSTAIASAVEQQGAATREIIQAVNQASIGTQEVTSNITGVSQAAEQTGEAAVQVQSSSAELATQAERLHHEMDKFLATVRAA